MTEWLGFGQQIHVVCMDFCTTRDTCKYFLHAVENIIEYAVGT